MKKNSTTKVFKTTQEMDEYLENTDLGKEFKQGWVLKKPVLKKINLDLPESVVHKIDLIAARMGVSRQPLLKVWIHERLKEEKV